MAQQGTINVTTDNIFPIIKQFLYSDQEIFLRELVSNAVDATQCFACKTAPPFVSSSITDVKRKMLASLAQELARWIPTQEKSPTQPQVEVVLDEAAGPSR